MELVHAMSPEGNPTFYTQDEIERYSKEFYLGEKDLETDFTRDSKPCKPTCVEQFPLLGEKDVNKRLMGHFLQYQLRDLVKFLKEFDFQHSDYRGKKKYPFPCFISLISGDLLSTQNRCR